MQATKGATVTQNLLSLPWIRVSLTGGEYANVSLLDSLRQAHEIRCLEMPSPLAHASVSRLLVAYLLASGDEPHTVEAQAVMLRAGRFDASRLEAYASDWSHRFNLVDREHPFLQSPDPMDDVPPSSIARLIAERTSGNNATLFDHTLDAAPPALTPAEAATYLVTHSAFALGGGVSRPFNFTDGPLARGASVMPRCSSLFETIVLMALPFGDAGPIPRIHRGEPDRPCWESDVPDPDKAGNRPRGFLNYLVWPSRRVRLIQDDDGLFRRCRYQQGLRIPDDAMDPFTGYRRDDKTGRHLVRRINPARALWRDSPALVEEQVSGDRASSLLHAILELASTTDVPPYRLEVVGMVTSQAKISSIHHERLPLGPAFVTSAVLRKVARDALGVADKGYDALRSGLRAAAAQLLAPGSSSGGRTPDKGDVAQLVASFGADSDYWPRLEIPFSELCVAAEDAADHSARSALLDEWDETVRAQARAVFSRVERTLGLRANGDAAAARGAWAFARELSKLLPVSAEEVSAP